MNASKLVRPQHMKSFLLFLISAAVFAMPVAFERRTPSQFVARFEGGTANISSTEFEMRGVKLRFAGASAAARMEGSGKAAPSTYVRAGFTKTFLQFPGMTIRDLYPGVDAIFYSSNGALEYDLQLAAGAVAE